MFKVASTVSSRSEVLIHLIVEDPIAQRSRFCSSPAVFDATEVWTTMGDVLLGGARCAMDRLLLPSLAHQCTITVQAMSLCARFLTSPRGGAKIRNTGAECETHGPIGDGAPVINLVMLLSRRRRVSIAGLEP